MTSTDRNRNVVHIAIGVCLVAAIVVAGLFTESTARAQTPSASDTNSPHSPSLLDPITGPTYTVTYSGNGNTSGSAPIDPQTYPAGTYVRSADIGDLARTGYKFGIWMSTLELESDSIFVRAGDHFEMPANDVTLYAYWNRAEPVTYYGNGNTSGTAPVDINSPETVGSDFLPEEPGDLKRSGYQFLEWNTKADGTGQPVPLFSRIRMPDTPLNLYAQWGKVYEVTYDGNGATSGVPRPELELVGATGWTSPPGGMSRPGYGFINWNTSPDGTGIKYDFTSPMPPHPLTLFATWSPTYPLTFDGNGNTGGSPPTAQRSPLFPGELFTVLDAGSLTRTDYAFTNWWNSKADGTGEYYQVGRRYRMPDGPLTLYAAWEYDGPAPPPPPPPAPRAQVANHNCAKIGNTRSIPRKGQKMLLHGGCSTNTGQIIGVHITGTKALADRRGRPLYKLVCKSRNDSGPVDRRHKKRLSCHGNNSLYIKTYGVKLKTTITWSAPGTFEDYGNQRTVYEPYRRTQGYRT